jgi:hypothetical protein
VICSKISPNWTESDREVSCQYHNFSIFTDTKRISHYFLRVKTCGK